MKFAFLFDWLLEVKWFNTSEYVTYCECLCYSVANEKEQGEMIHSDSKVP